MSYNLKMHSLQRKLHKSFASMYFGGFTSSVGVYHILFKVHNFSDYDSKNVLI